MDVTCGQSTEHTTIEYLIIAGQNRKRYSPIERRKTVSVKKQSIRSE
ncbi:hypothetical protein CEXT_222691, partial [Caerostris extrusa]